MSFFKKLLMISAVVLLIGGLYGCQKEGPAEKAGKTLDKAMGDAKDKLDEATK